MDSGCETRSKELSSEINSLREEVMSLKSEISEKRHFSSLEVKVLEVGFRPGTKDITFSFPSAISRGLEGESIITTSIVATLVTDTIVTPSCSTVSRFGQANRQNDDFNFSVPSSVGRGFTLDTPPLPVCPSKYTTNTVPSERARLLIVLLSLSTAKA